MLLTRRKAISLSSNIAAALAVSRAEALIPLGGGHASGGSFTPLQHISMEQFTVGLNNTVLTGGYAGTDQFNIYNGTDGLGYGGTISTNVVRPGKTRSCMYTCQAGTTGSPGDGTPSTHGLWGTTLNPPTSATAPRQYGGQGDIWHLGFWYYIPTGTFLGSSSLTDGAQKFLLNAFPDYGTTGKDDVHICGHKTSGDGNFQGIALINEFDPNEGTNNTYPSTRSGTNNNAYMTFGQWNWIETACLLQSNGDLAWRRVWVDDVLVLQRAGRVITWLDTSASYHTQTLGVTGNPTLPNSSAQLEFTLHFTFWNSNAPTQVGTPLAPDTVVYVDDYVTTTTAFNGPETNLPNRDSFGNPIIGSAYA